MFAIDQMKRLLPILLLVFSVGVGASGIHECDELTANPADSQRVTDGITAEEFNGRGTAYAERAIRACTQAIDAFPEEARFLYQLGRALQMDGRSQEAEWWLKLAIKKGYCYAYLNYGRALSDRNRKEQVISVVQEGAEKGCPAAQSHLGWLYTSGYGSLSRDYAKAHKWNQRALMQGFATAASNMGTSYFEGKGVPRNLVAAYAYYSIAQALGASPSLGQWMRENADAFSAYTRSHGEKMAAEIWAKIEAAKSGKSKRKSGGTGTGFIINTQGHVVTNSHVVNDCGKINTVQNGARVSTTVVTDDPRNDLALLKMDTQSDVIAYFRGGRGVRAGEDILAFGFPLKRVLSDDLKGTKGMVNALAGLGNDTRFMQMSAPVQPGNVVAHYLIKQAM